MNPLGYHNVPEVNEVVSVLVNMKEKTYVDGNVTLDDLGQFVVAFRSDTHTKKGAITMTATMTKIALSISACKANQTCTNGGF
jgi:hypothetical protein